MAQTVAKDVLELLKRDGSKRAAHFACLRAIPFCRESETLEDGVERLAAWFDMSVELKHQPLHQVIIIVLACFLVTGSNRVTCGADLNERWLETAYDVVAPFAAKVNERYIADAEAVAICTLYNSMPEKYGEKLLSTHSRGCSCAARRMLTEHQTVVSVEQVRRKLVSKLVESAMKNVLKGVKDDARCQRLRLKKQRRKLVKSMQSVSLVGQSPVCDEHVTSMHTESNLPLERVKLSISVGRGETSSAADECIVCLEPIGSKRALFTCGHARCCGECAATVHECPMCRQPVSILMEIFV